MNDYRGIGTTEELHAAVDAKRHAPDFPEWEAQMDAHVKASGLAHDYAPHNQRHANVDRWLSRQVNSQTDLERIIRADMELRELGVPYIVVDNNLRSRPTHACLLYAHSLKADGGPVFRSTRGACDRCMADSENAAPIHIARFGLVAEIILCLGCRDDLEAIVGEPLVIARAE